MPLALLVCLLTAAQPIVLSDGEGLAGWPKEATLIDDAKVGAHAVRLPVPAGIASGPSFSFGPTGIEPSKAQYLSFWYRFTGTGHSSLMIKLVAPITEGWQGTWLVDENCPADGAWHQVRIDLGSPYLQWGDKPDLDGRWIGFRTQAEAGAKLTLDIDQLQLEPVLYHASLHSEAGPQNALSGRLTVSNPAQEPVILEAGQQRIDLAPGQSREVVLDLPIDAAALAAAPPLQSISGVLRVQVAGQPETAMDLPYSYSAPLELPPHPRLLLSTPEVAEVKARAAADPVLKARLEAVVSDATNRLARPIDLPPRGGQWYHWYACKVDGANLRTKSPTEHECPVCHTIYSGWPYDDVVLSNQHGELASRIRAFGLAYALTGDEQFAQRARLVLLAYADKYDSYPLHDIHGKPTVGGGKVGPQTLDESTWLIPVCQGADLVWNTLSAEDQATLTDKLFRPAAQVISKHKMGIHNIQCWKNSAVGLVGLLLGDSALVAEAVKGGSGYENQIARGVNLDGQWYEGAWGYHFYTMNAIAPLAEAGARCGLGLYEFERDGRSYRLLFDGPLNLAMPNGVLPNFSDSSFVNVAGSASLYELAYRRYNDPRFGALIARTKADSLEGLLVGRRPLPPTGAVNAGSADYPHAGYAVLQAGGGDQATWACLKYGPYGGGHGHPDKLSLILYSRGQVFGLDPGTGKYGVPIHDGWQRASAAHSTLIVDETNQAAVDGQGLAFTKGDGWTAALADAGPIYAGVNFRRAVALVGDDLLLVLDSVSSDKPRTLDLAWHLGGNWSTKPVGEAVAMPDKPGYRYLQDVVKLAGATPRITQDPLTIDLSLASPQHGETWTGTGPGDNTTQRHPVIVRRTVGQAAQVGWAISLSGTPAKLELTEQADGWRLAAERAGQATSLLVGTGETPTVSVEVR